MPKRFGHTVCLLATIMMTFSFVGCRTTTTKLASVPGLSWLERNDEGWAQYEPAPDLPSATSEPSGLNSGPDNIAASSKPKTFGNPFETPGDRTSNVAASTNPRFDASRYMPKKNEPLGNGSGTRNAASNYGDYASAYGKYGPPKALYNKSDASSSSSIAGTATPQPQKGLYTAGASGLSTAAGTAGDKLAGQFGAATSSANGQAESRFGQGPKFDNSAASDRAAGSVAFNKSGLTSQPADSKPATEAYVPPGFVRSPTPSKYAERFGGFTTQVADGARAAADKTEKAVGQQFAAAKNEMLQQSAPQTFNRFSNPGVEPTSRDMVSSPAVNAKNTLAAAAGQVQRFATDSHSALVASPQSLSTQTEKATQRAGEAANRFGGTLQNNVDLAQRKLGNLANAGPAGSGQTASSGVGQVTSRFGEAATSATAQLQSGAANLARSVGNSPTVAAAQDTLSAAKESAQGLVNNTSKTATQTREAIRGMASTAGANTRNIMQNVSTALQPAYPSTSTPNPFVIPGGAVSGGRTPATNGAASPSANPTPTAPSGTPTIRSSAPFRPGSTSSFQGATTVQKPLVELASNTSQPGEEDRLVLAVGDKYQFPRVMR